MREHSRYLRGMFAWVGFDQTGVQYVRGGRYAGSSEVLPARRWCGSRSTGIVSFSTAPLRLALNLGFLVSVLAFLVGVAAILVKVFGRTTPSRVGVDRRRHGTSSAGCS